MEGVAGGEDGEGYANAQRCAKSRRMAYISHISVAYPLAHPLKLAYLCTKNAHFWAFRTVFDEKTGKKEGVIFGYLSAVLRCSTQFRV